MGKRLIRRLFWSLGALALMMITAHSVTAATATGTPDTYKITFEVRFRKQGEAAYPSAANVVGTDVDVTGVSPGGTTATMTATVDVGNYDKVQVIMNCTVKLKGSVSYSGSTYVTTAAGGVSTSGSAAEGSYSLPSAFCSGGTTVTIESPTFSPPFTVGGTVTITFNAAGALSLDFTGAPPSGPVLSPGAFSASMTTS